VLVAVDPDEDNRGSFTSPSDSGFSVVPARAFFENYRWHLAVFPVPSIAWAIFSEGVRDCDVNYPS
jgi:hypothetical protein